MTDCAHSETRQRRISLENGSDPANGMRISANAHINSLSEKPDQQLRENLATSCDDSTLKMLPEPAQNFSARFNPSQSWPGAPTIISEYDFPWSFFSNFLYRHVGL